MERVATLVAELIPDDPRTAGRVPTKLPHHGHDIDLLSL